MGRIVTRHDVDHAIDAWLRALAEVESCRSVSGVLHAAARYGCRISGGTPPEPRLSRLRDAERVLGRCTRRERLVLQLRYRFGGNRVLERPGPDGRRTDYLVRVLVSYSDIARAMGISCRQARECISSARAKIRSVLKGNV